MECEGCGKEKATIHLIEVVDGKKTTRVLCKSCHAQQHDAIDPELLVKGASEALKVFAPLVGPALQDLQDQLEAKGKAAAPARSSKPMAPCRHCGMTWAEFRKNSRFGCALCYDAFGESLPALFAKVQGADHHEGRLPKRAVARLSRTRRLGELRGDLEVAVKSEDYEAAARLRDQIRVLETEEDTPLGAR